MPLPLKWLGGTILMLPFTLTQLWLIVKVQCTAKLVSIHILQSIAFVLLQKKLPVLLLAILQCH